MKIEYQRTARHSYMVVRQAKLSGGEYELQMILHNEISGLLDLQTIVEDGQREYWYDVTGMQSLQHQFAAAPLDAGGVRRILQGLCNMKQQMEDYMLDDGNIDFSPSMVFFDRFSEQIRFCYIPGYAQVQAEGICGLLEQMLKYLDHTDEEAVRLGYDIYERCRQTAFTIEDCRRCLSVGWEETPVLPKEEDDGGLEDLPEKENLEDDLEYLTGMQPDRPGKKYGRKKRRWGYGREKKTDKETDVSKPRQISGEIPAVDGGICTDDGEGRTVWLSEEQIEKSWKLVYQGDGAEEDFRIEKLPFRIGKASAKADGILRAQTVSRIHACISGSREELYVEDYNSTNGTYLNGRLLPMNTPVKLKSGDCLVFATEKYILRDLSAPML